MPQTVQIKKTLAVDKMLSDRLFASDFYEIKQLDVNLADRSQDVKGYNDSLCMVYVKKGNFLLDYFTRSYDMPSGYILLDKPDYEYRIRPANGVCTLFNFTAEFYRRYTEEMGLKKEGFFSNPNVLSVMLQSGPDLDYLHYQVLKKINSAAMLEMDTLVFEFFNQVAAVISNNGQQYKAAGPANKYSLASVEAARDYLNENFAKDISLKEIAASCFISPFHFSRLFKKITGLSPYKYLQKVRLKHAEVLLKNSVLPIADIAFTAGFNSMAYFATSFRQQYNVNPLQYRKENRSC